VYSSTLLPPIARFVSSARIRVDVEGRHVYIPGQSLTYDCQGARHCLDIVLQRLPSLTSFHMTSTNTLHTYEVLRSVNWRRFTQLLPSLRHLSLDCVDLVWEDALRPLLTASSSLTSLHWQDCRCIARRDDPDDNEMARGQIAESNRYTMGLNNAELRLGLCRNLRVLVRTF
jgi:hypothetical protein